LSTLKFGVRSQSQAMALSTVGTIHGRSTADRMSRFSGSFSLRMSARPSPAPSFRIVAPIV
jgi:hypothetical protein